VKSEVVLRKNEVIALKSTQGFAVFFQKAVSPSGKKLVS
jgi:hypothetical protein